MPIAVHIDWSAHNGPRFTSVGGGTTATWRARNDHSVSIGGAWRLDNAAGLASALGMQGRTPAELICASYAAWGAAFVSRLEGDFSIVLWDAASRCLVAARDPFGCVPLFYRQLGPETWFGSEVGQIADASKNRSELDDQRVMEFLLGRYKSYEATFFRDIREVPPGTITTQDARGLRSRRYWAPPVAPDRRGKREDYYAEFRRLFIESVSKRLRSESPVVVHVSGGVDSSAIAGATDLIARSGELGAPAVVGASGRYPGLSCDEGTYIEAVARRVSFPLETWDATRSPLLDLTEPSLNEPGGRAIHRGGTLGDIAIAHAHGAKVIVSGVGGDELGLVIGKIKDLLDHGKLVAAVSEFLGGAGTSERFQRMKFLAWQYLPQRLRSLNVRLRTEVPAWVAPAVRDLARETFVPSMPESVGRLSAVQAAMWNRLTSAQTARALSAIQQVAFSQGIEYRFPFLDTRLVGFVLTMPYELWPSPGASARLHREPLRDLLPEEVADRSGKAEFTSAVAHQVERAAPTIQRLFDQGPWFSEKYVDRLAAKALWRAVADAPGRSRASDWGQVWAIVSLEAWLRRILGYSQPHLGGESAHG